MVHGWRTTGNLGRSNEFKGTMTKLWGWTKRLWNMCVVSSIRDVYIVQSVVLGTNGDACSQNKILKRGDTSSICGRLYAFKRINLVNNCGWRTKFHFKDHLLTRGCLKNCFRIMGHLTISKIWCCGVKFCHEHHLGVIWSCLFLLRNEQNNTFCNGVTLRSWLLGGEAA